MKINSEQVLIYLDKLEGFPVVLSLEKGKVKFEYINNTGVYSDRQIEKEIQKYMDKEIKLLVRSAKENEN